MAEKDKKNIEKQVPNNVIALGPTKCKAENCKAKPTKAGFCNEHYDWFKEGLITAEGQPAKDFDKKYQHFLRHKKSAA